MERRLFDLIWPFMEAMHLHAEFAYQGTGTGLSMSSSAYVTTGLWVRKVSNRASFVIFCLLASSDVYRLVVV
jgi:hypothetical protein